MRNAKKADRRGQYARMCAAGGVLALLSACAPQSLAMSDLPKDAQLTAALAACCGSTGAGVPEQATLWIEQNSASLPRLLRETKLRPAYLETQTDAHDALLARLKPMDVIVNRNGSRLAGGHGFSYFGHAALYVGTEAQLKALGIWDHPEVRPHQNAIRAGAVAIEATEKGVHLSAAPELFEADTTVVLRPRGCRVPCAGAVSAFSLIGRGFDYHLAVDDGDDELICTEVLTTVLPELNLPERDVIGHHVILPDEIVAHSLAGKIPLDFITAIEGYPQGWRVRSAREVAALVLGAYQ